MSNKPIQQPDIKQEQVSKKRIKPRIPFTSNTLHGWSSSAISSAINMSMQGEWKDIVDLFKILLTDAKFKAALDKRVQGLLRSDRIFIPGTSENDLINDKESIAYAEYIAKGVEELTYYSLASNDFTLFFRDYIAFGMALAFVSWTITDDGFYVPCFSHMDLSYLKWDQMKQKFIYRNTEQGDVEIDAGHGNWIMMTTWKPGEVTGAVSALAMSWYYKNLLQKQAIQATENQMDPIVLLKRTEPGEPTISQDDEDNVSQLLFDLQRQKSERVMYTEGYELETVDTSGDFSIMDAKSYIEKFDRDYLVCLLGSNLGTEMAGGGSYAAAMTHAGVEKNYSESDAITVSNCLSEQFLPYVTEFNWDNAWDQSPMIKWIIRPGIDQGQYASALSTLFSAIGSIPEGIEVTNLEEIYHLFGLSVKNT